MKKVLTVFGLFFLVLLAAAGGFWGGMRYESNRAERVQANFFNERGQGNMGSFPQEGQFPGGWVPSGSPGAGGTMGEVKTYDGNMITVSTAQDITTVQLTDATQIVKSVTGTVADLQPGLRVRITGERAEDGSINAAQVTILSDEFTSDGVPAPEDPQQTGTEP